MVNIGGDWGETKGGVQFFVATCVATAKSQNIARQVARGVLHCAMLQKSVAALPQSLRKVELDSTKCNACCNKNVVRLGDCRVCYTVQFLVQLVSQQNCETSCTKNCIV